MAEEVKAGWTLKYILLTAFLSVITGAVGYSLKMVFDAPAATELTVERSLSGNTLADAIAAPNTPTIRLSGPNEDSSKDVRVFGTYSIAIRNSGTKTVSNISLTVSVPKKLELQAPRVSTAPPELVRLLKVANASPGKDESLKTIDVLDAGNSISLEYTFYAMSDVGIDESDFGCVVRAPDCRVEYAKPTKSAGLDLSPVTAALFAVTLAAFAASWYMLRFTRNRIEAIMSGAK